MKTLGKLAIIMEVNVNDTTSEEGFSFLGTDIKEKLKSVITLNHPSRDINIITSQKHWFPHHNQIVCDLWNIEDSTRRPPQSNNCKWRGGPPKYSSFDEIVKNFWAHYNLHHLWNMQRWTLIKIGCVQRGFQKWTW